LRKDDLDLALNFIQVWKEPRNLKRWNLHVFYFTQICVCLSIKEY
jgi:hypothetical protein